MRSGALTLSHRAEAVKLAPDSSVPVQLSFQGADDAEIDVGHALEVTTQPILDNAGRTVPDGTKVVFRFKTRGIESTEGAVTSFGQAR